MGLSLKEAVRLANERLNDPVRAAAGYEQLRNRPEGEQLDDAMVILALLMHRLRHAVRAGNRGHQATLMALEESRTLVETTMGYELLDKGES